MRPAAAIRRLASFVALVLAALWIGAPAALAAEVPFVGQGKANYLKKKEAMRARSEALDSATADAVKKALPRYVPKDMLAERQEEIESQVLPLSVGFVKRTEIVKEEDVDKCYTITVKAWIDEATLRQSLDGLGFSQDVSSRRSIAVIVDEFFQGDQKPQDPNTPILKKKVDIEKYDESYDRSVDASHDRSVDARARSSVAASHDASVDASARTSGAVVTGRGAAYGSASGSVSAAESDRYAASRSASYSEKEKDRYKERESARASEFKMHVEEYFPPTLLQIKSPDPASRAAFEKRMLERDVRIVDQKTVDAVRSELIGPKGVVTDVLKDEQMLAKKAMSLGEKYGADAIAVGVATVVYEGERGGVHSSKTGLAIRVIDTATGDVLASQIAVQGGVSSSATASGQSSATRVGDVLGQEISEQLFQYWKNRDEKGIEVTVRIAGLANTRQKLAALDAITATEGVVEVEERSYDNQNGLVEFVLTTKLNVAKVKNGVLRSLYKVEGLEGLEEEMSLGANISLVRH